MNKPTQKSILNKLNNRVMEIVMSTATSNFPSLIDYDETFNAVWKKCPGMEFLIQNANYAYMTGMHKDNRGNIELQERCMKLYVQCVVAFNMLVVLHNLEESDKLEKELSGVVEKDIKDIEIEIQKQVISDMYDSFLADPSVKDEILKQFRDEAGKKLGIAKEKE